MSEQLPAAPSLIDGDWVVPEGTALAVVDPFTEREIGASHEAGETHVAAAVRSADAAQRDWGRVGIEERAVLLERVASLVTRDEEKLARMVSREMGMPITLARVTQSQVPASVLRATANCARQFPWSEATDGATLFRNACGVVGAITPWNMPIHQIVAKVAAAVVAGATVVLKASEQTPYDANLLATLFLEAGCPPGVFNVVTGSGPVTGAALAAHPGLSRVSFTGSVGAGKQVAQLAAASLTRCTLELGGKSPAIILPDADLEPAVTAAVTNGLINSGQACNAPTRLLLPQHLAGQGEAIAVAAAEALALGDPSAESTQQGPLVNERQRDRVLAFVAEATDQGGHLLTGTGKQSDRTDTGYFVDPTIITGLSESARAVREEIFGPVIVVQTYNDVEDAIRIANDSAYGLSAEVWSADVEHAAEVGRRLSVGQVKINGVRTRNRPTVPFGGMRDSGYGRELGAMGIEEFTDLTAVMT